ncbi:MAG: RluA family pseudouridine synthase [Bdellovibrionaceae bacterium]|nr:RluA family pseudouridine synthase [Pseudobdellovibrionaceae bacterium]
MQQNRGFEYGVIHIHSLYDGPIVEIVSMQLEIPPQEVQRLLDFGGIYFENRRITHNQEVEKNNLVRIHTRPRRFLRQVSWPERILWQDSDYLVIDKPSGLPCHPTVDNLYENVITQLSKALNQPLFLTHRLDLPTSGVLVFAKNKKSQSTFNKALGSSVSKIYEALVEHPNQALTIPLGPLTHFMEPSPRAPKVVHKNKIPGSLHCELEILKTERRNDSQSWIQVRLGTGRTHQIRAQLATLGFPIVGDTMYGAHSSSPKDADLGWDTIELRATQITWSPYLWQTDGL